MKPRLLFCFSLSLAACTRESAIDKPGHPGPTGSTPEVALAGSQDRAGSYLQRLARFQTKLLRRGPAPQAFHNDVPPAGVRETTYQSDGLALRAWVATPQAPSGEKLPGVVYLHGGFAFGADDFRDATPFLHAGLLLMCPMLRGENGNPGDYEMFMGEVRDAKAAVAWLARQSNVDPTRIYAFGHSSGGVISALLSLHDAGLRHSGSAGGLYGPELFDWMKSDVPFSSHDSNERTFRVLVGNIGAMRHPHYAFVGASDPGQAVAAAKRELDQKGLLAITSVQGNHLTSLAPAISAYLEVIEQNP